MSEIKAFESQISDLAEKYEQSLETLNSSYRFRNQDLQSTIALINRAKGGKSMRRFAEELGVNPSSVSRILNGQVSGISNEVLARVVTIAIPESEVTLEAVMDAQGLKVASPLQTNLQRNEYLSLIVIEEILRHGYSVTVIPREVCEEDIVSFPFLKAINTNAISQGNSQWLFSVAFRVPKLGKHNRSSLQLIQSFMAQNYISADCNRRSSVIFDVESDYQYHKMLCSKLSIADEISLLLVSREERRVVEEYIIPLRDGSTPKSVFN